MKKIILQIIIISGAIFVFFSQANAANHDITGLPLTTDGWTDFEAMIQNNGYQDSRVVFVSSLEGNDNTAQVHDISSVVFDADGIFQSSGTVYPYQTIAAAYTQMRDGYPDILLLKRGDEWSAGLGVSYPRNGASQTAPHIIASYGESVNKPKLIGFGFNTYNRAHILVSSLHFYSADWLVSGRALDIRGTASYQTFEDLYIEQKAGDIVQGVNVNNIVFRRSIWLHGEAHDGQLFAERASNVLLEENLFYEPYDDYYPDNNRFGRSLYFAHGELTYTIRECIFFGGDRGAVDLRKGGIFHDNLLVQAGFSVGDNGSGTRYITSIEMYNNVFMEGSPRTGDATRVGILGNDGSNFFNNILTDTQNVTRNSIGFSIVGLTGSNPPQLIAKNLNFSNNIIYGFNAFQDTGNGIRISSGLEVENISMIGNDIQMVYGHRDGAIVAFPSAYFPYATFANNRYYSTEPQTGWFYQGDHDAWVSASGETGSSIEKVNYPDPDRTMRTYNASLGGNPSSEEFMAEALFQSRTNWRDEYTASAVNDYIREGFGASKYSGVGPGPIIRSDVDGSSEVTTTDALLTLRNSLGLSMNGTAWRASATTGDVNCDGVSNSTDALLILRHSLGLSMSGTTWCE